MQFSGRLIGRTQAGHDSWRNKSSSIKRRAEDERDPRAHKDTNFNVANGKLKLDTGGQVGLNG